MTWERARQDAGELLSILEYLHGQGVIHRDLKPANVIRLTSGRLKILDFGLALLTNNDRTRLTGGRVPVGGTGWLCAGGHASPASAAGKRAQRA